MGISSAHAAAFYREVAANQVVWAIRDAGGFPAPRIADRGRSMPFWSSEARARSIIETIAAYGGFSPLAIPWSIFCERWVTGLAADGLLAGVNWSGSAASGFDIEPAALQRNVEALLHDAAPNLHLQPTPNGSAERNR